MMLYFCFMEFVESRSSIWQGAATGLVVSALNHVAHRVSGPETQMQKKPKIVHTTEEAIDHYYNGEGEPVELGMATKKEVVRSPETKRVIQRLVKGIAEKRSSNYGVDLTKKTFHVGDTRVDYNTSCTTTKCVTTFKAFSGDGFRDPLDIGIEVGGTPYNYITWEFSISYKNPGYLIGTNIK